MSARPFRTILIAAIVIPTHSLSGWRLEKFSHIKPNAVTANKAGLTIKVASSASPLIYKLDSPVRVAAFRVSGEFQGLPHFSDVSKQGKKDFDDYALRVGFVVPGSKTLTGIKRFFAADWVKHLYSELPKGVGLDYIQFFDVAQDRSQLGEVRVSSSSKLIHEKVFAVVNKPGPFDYHYKLSPPIKSAAIWLSIDGDDTKSKFTVVIDHFELTNE